VLFNLGFAAPLLGAFKPSIILFRIIASHHMVRILDARPHHRHGPSTTTHRHTTPTCPSLTVWSIITGRCAHQYKLVHLHLGYYINPLLNVLLGILIYKESLLWPQKLSIAIAILGVAIMTVQLGTLPIVSIVLAVSFSLYGAVKKRLTIHPFSSIAFEAWLITPIALWYLAAIDTTSWAFIENLTPTGLLLIGAGLTTSIPLILFSYGARLLPLNVLGFLQYLSPTMGFFLAIFYFGESFGTAQLIAFGCIWVALVLFTLSNQMTTRIKIKK